MILVKAEMLPNLVLRLVFENKEIRYFYLRKKGSIKNVEFWLLGATNGWIGHELVIDEKGENLVIDGKSTYSTQELYENSQEHLTF